MRILLIAHEFPPIPSPQSLRWAYLTRELAHLGHHIEVLAPDHPGYGAGGGLPALPESVVVHRTFPGLLAWSLKRLSFRRARKLGLYDAKTGPALTGRVPEIQVRLNWKGRLFERIRKAYEPLLFPDVRAEWNPWARRALRSLLSTYKPDIVIVSHEPASTLYLGLLAKRHGYPLIADLGDPVYATYTPRRWRRKSLRLERRICEQADLVIVTTASARRLLMHRHGIGEARIDLITQGFDDSRRHVDKVLPILFDPVRVELLYTGSFYKFRRADALITSVVGTPRVRLNVASLAAPSELVEAAQRHPESIRLLGFLPHERALQLQQGADMLVNLANTDPSQVPGKVYEYLGSSRPILHVSNDLADEAAALIRQTGAGWVCADDPTQIAAILAEQVARLDSGLRPERQGDNQEIIKRYGWSALAHELAERIARIAALTTKSDIQVSQ